MSFAFKHTENDIVELFKKIFKGEVIELKPITVGLVNAVYNVTTKNNEYIVRISPDERKWNNFAEEI